MSHIISTDKAPGAIGPYSQAVVAGGLVFTSGQLPTDPQSGEITGEDIKTQTKRVMENIVAVLAAAGTGLDKVVKTTCFLADMGDFAAFNEVYGDYFAEHKPARSCIAAKSLPKNVLVEVETIAEI